ncbi:hypothetical protein [Cryptosporangium minutisporangium]|uniref:Uncharacterized protein n=1 Tax=Cryptosporangium minutisporangium TaxID=113569 RepID=A0ABP6SY50_9ACTN
MDETRTRALLTTIAADAAPPTGVDLAGIVKIGRRRRKRAPRWIVAAAAAVVLLLTITTVALLRPDGEKPPPPTVAPTSFDPRTTRIVPGWLPDGIDNRGHLADPRREAHSASRVEGGMVTITLLPRGGTPPAFVAMSEPGPAVRGAPSTWTVSLDGQRGRLSWEWAPDALVYIDILPFKGYPDLRALVARVAADLRVGAERPAALPFTVEVPPGLRVSEMAESRSDSGNVVLSFEGRGGQKQPTARLMLSRYSPNRRPRFEPNTTAGGRPTMVAVQGERVEAVQMLGGHELTVFCLPWKGLTGIGLRDECMRFIGSVRPVGELNRPETWSTAPIR